MMMLSKAGLTLIHLSLIIVLLYIAVPGVISDLCQPDKLTAQMMSEKLFMRSLPKLGPEAGQYLQDKSATNPSMCILSCCKIATCNVALFTKDHCYTIECNRTDPTACEPKLQHDPVYNSTFMFLVRTPAEVEPTCDVETQTGCGEHQTCELSVGSLVTHMCVCNHGYKWQSPNSKICVAGSDGDLDMTLTTTPPVPCTEGEGDCGPRQECMVTSPGSKEGVCWCKEGFNTDSLGNCKYTIVTCEFGISMCDTYEECLLAKGSKSKVGVCECQPGFTRDENGHCLSAVPAKTTTATPTDDITTVTSVVAAHATFKPSTEEISSTTPKVKLLTVSAGEDKQIHLPDNKVTLKAFVLPSEDPADPYHYDWSLERHPEGSESGQMDGKNTNTLLLSDLIAGIYTFKVRVAATNKLGEATVNVTVLPPEHVNEPPVAIINPATLQIKIQNTAILDGSDSTDDDKIVTYYWEEVSGPIQDHTITDDNAILTLKNLAPGNYTFKLTVTDSDGATNSTTANVTAIKDTDYPPKADAGSDVVIHLPENSVLLYGNLSTDDKGIVKYEWFKSNDDTLAADMQGVRTQELHVSNLEVGDYTFTLKVTDAADQTSTADVHVFVKPAENQPPVAKTTDTLDIALPLDSITLDGSASTDDTVVTAYHWQQKEGPTTLTLTDAEQPVAHVSGNIQVGKYLFKLTVEDAAGLKSSSILTVTVGKSLNEPPVADAGPDQVIQLPQLLVVMNGSRSHDNYKISSYLWERDSSSLAAGEILNASNHQAVLQLVNLVAGHYSFTLTVTDAEGLSNKDKASVTVKEDEDRMDLLELLIDADIRKFTAENKKKLEGQLALLVPKSPLDGEAVINIKKLEEDHTTGSIRVNFIVIDVMKDSRKVRPGVGILKTLKKKLLSTSNILDYSVVSLDTYVCQNNCSGHGHCNLQTKICVCEAFWTQNFFVSLIHHESNCDWSILYVVIICFILLLTVTGSVWGCFCCWRRRRCRCRLRSKKRHRYSLLQDAEDEKENIEMSKSTGKKQNTSVMFSESEFSSEEETLFVNHKNTNGFIPKRLNGVAKPLMKTKTKA